MAIIGGVCQIVEHPSWAIQIIAPAGTRWHNEGIIISR